MQLKAIGTFFIIAASWGFGHILCLKYASEMKTLSQLLSVLEFMKCELTYKMAPLSQLCRDASGEATGELKRFLLELKKRL